MSTLRRLLTVAAAVFLAATSGAGAAAPPGQPATLAGGAVAGTAFTYQGRLNDGGAPAAGLFDFEFKLYDAAANGNLFPVEEVLDNVTVAGGLFTVRLDFGEGAFTGEARWLEIGVRPGASVGAFTPLLPRQELTATPLALALPGLYTEPNATSPNVIGGWAGNYVEPNMVGATIGGGGAANGNGNGVLSNYSTVGGGRGNQAGPSLNALAQAGGGQAPGGDPIPSGSTVSGGEYNLASGINATIGGGYENTASGNDATVGGGQSNTAAGFSAAVVGGWSNSAASFYAAVGGGYNNLAGAHAAVVAGGSGNIITTTADYAFVGGGEANTLNGDWGVIAGGRSNTVTAAGQYAAIGGGDANLAAASYAVVGGGRINDAGGSYATVAGGYNNSAGFNSATVSGGQSNTADAFFATVGGGSSNEAAHVAATVGGGSGNTASGQEATVGGGDSNTASDEGATVAGGQSNLASGNSAAVAGGQSNIASGNGATVGGGLANMASGDYAALGGGSGNIASGAYAAVPGGAGNTATLTATLAAGYSANAVHQGSFVWSDVSGSDFSTTEDNSFIIRAVGGVGLGTNAPDGQLHVASSGGASAPQVSISQTVAGNQFARLRFQQAGKSTFWDIAIGGTNNVFNIYSGTSGSGANILSLTPTDATDLMLMSNGAHLTIGGIWTNNSDRDLKTAFAPVDSASILDALAALPLYTWQYRAEPETVRHLGPTAQDFRAAFGLGSGDTSITTLDADGVALAAIQGLHAENQSLQARVAALEARAPNVPLPWLLFAGLGLLNAGYFLGRRRAAHAGGSR